MRMSARYLYLNRSGNWPHFHLEGLERTSEGLLRLEPLPAPASPLPAGLDTRPPASGLSGLAVGLGGTVYWTEPGSGSLFLRDGCSGRVAQVRCVGGPGPSPTSLHFPRGLLYHRGLGRLFVVDSGDNRILVMDPMTWQLTDVWGAGDPSDPDVPALLRDPQGLAHDEAGNLYVGDHGNGLVRKFDPRGVEIPAFSAAQIGHGWHPTSVAVGRDASGRETVYALDPPALVVRPIDLDGTPRGSVHLKKNNAPIGMAVEDGGAFFVGDGQRSRIQKYRVKDDKSDPYIGEAHYHGPVTALTLDGCGDLLVLPDASGPLLLAMTGGRITVGHLWGGPFSDPTLVTESWHRLRAEGPPPPPGSEQTLYVLRSVAGVTPSPPWASSAVPTVKTPAVPLVATPPASPTVQPIVKPLAQAQVASPPAPLESGVWYRAARNAPECFFSGTPGETVWVAVEFKGDGDATPTLAQLRFDFQYEALAAHLPDCYFDDVPGRGLASRLVGLFGGLFEDASAAIDRLPARFDPDAAPVGDLVRLAALLGLSPSPEATPARLRSSVAGAAATTAERGTTRGLVKTLLRELGVHAVVEEPIRQARCWVLPGDCGPGDTPDGSLGVGSVLGVTTALAAGEPQGPVIGSTLTLDQTQLIADEELGLSLFGEVAHRLVVRIRPPAGSGPEFLDSVRRLLDREVPCHLSYHLCPIEPRMRLGVQARLGFDAVLAGPAEPSPLDAVAGGALPTLDSPPVARLGPSGRLGRMTYLGTDTPEPLCPPEGHS